MVPPALVLRSSQYSAMRLLGASAVGSGMPVQQPLLVSPKVMKPLVETLNVVWGWPKNSKSKPIGSAPETASSPDTASVVGAGRSAKVPAAAVGFGLVSVSSCPGLVRVGQLSVASPMVSLSSSSSQASPVVSVSLLT